MDKILAGQPLKVPTMLVHSLWDAEDIYGARPCSGRSSPRIRPTTSSILTMGPWYHGQGIDKGRSTGVIQWDQDTSQMVAAPGAGAVPGPLSQGRTPMDVAPVTAFQSGSNVWQRLDGWPAAPGERRAALPPARRRARLRAERRARRRPPITGRIRRTR